jgi:hypothetical protein
MKNKITYSLLLAAASCGVSLGQTTAYTTPVGYTTQTLTANAFNLVGRNVLPPTLVAGKVTGVSGAAVTDTSANFLTALPVGKTCILEITSGIASGTVQEFVTWTADTITLPAAVAGIAANDSYTVRIAPTLQTTFPVGTLTGSPLATNADKVWVPNGVGGYVKYWYKTVIAPVGWHTTTSGINDTGVVVGDIPLISIDGVLIEKKGAAGSLVQSGEVKTTGSNVLVNPGFNLISINPPVGLTLFTSGLNGDILGSPLATNADKVWVPNGLGGYTKYWIKTVIAPTGWHTTTTGVNDTGLAVDVALPSSVFIERKGGAKVLTMDVPAGYSNL